jgi:hypothetical protein
MVLPFPSPPPLPPSSILTFWCRADETEHTAVSIDDYALPEPKSLPHVLPTGEKAHRVARWKWLDPEWKPVVIPNQTDADGWIYTDNTWKNPGPGEAFGKYTVIPPYSTTPSFRSG